MNPHELDSDAVKVILGAIRGRLIRKESAVVPGLGILKVAHSPSAIVVGETGSQLTPPRDYVVFDAGDNAVDS